jgi:hypothetical protein
LNACDVICGDHDKMSSSAKSVIGEQLKLFVGVTDRCLIQADDNYKAAMSSLFQRQLGPAALIRLLWVSVGETWRSTRPPKRRANPLPTPRLITG